MKLPRALLPILVGSLLALAAVGCSEETPEPVETIRPVKMLTIGASGAAATREYPGRISAAQSADVAFEVAGKILEFPIEEG